MKKDYFLIHTIGFAIISAALYIWKGITESFYIGTYVYIILNLAYCPLALIFKKKSFCLFQVFYAFALIFIYAFCPSYLYNNYSAFLVICIVCLYRPQWKRIILAAYFVLVSIAFALNTESICHYIIHLIRCSYFFFVFYHVIHRRFERIIGTDNTTGLELTEDEINILEQMISGKKQKEVTGFSINTVTKKLNNAKIRNNIGTTQELIFRYLEEIRLNKHCD